MYYSPPPEETLPQGAVTDPVDYSSVDYGFGRHGPPLFYQWEPTTNAMYLAGGSPDNFPDRSWVDSQAILGFESTYMQSSYWPGDVATWFPQLEPHQSLSSDTLLIPMPGQYCQGLESKGLAQPCAPGVAGNAPQTRDKSARNGDRSRAEEVLAATREMCAAGAKIRAAWWNQSRCFPEQSSSATNDKSDAKTTPPPPYSQVLFENTTWESIAKARILPDNLDNTFAAVERTYRGVQPPEPTPPLDAKMATTPPADDTATPVERQPSESSSSTASTTDEVIETEKPKDIAPVAGPSNYMLRGRPAGLASSTKRLQISEPMEISDSDSDDTGE